ncbi:type VII secretion protein EssC [Lactococcus ileimucosae]|uniref:type VII secretion protein EssC n=1 Tax=Lactococcus ileimucosae TaxID=2941329 RepID=UPI00204466F2|nr:type VII secretion protein EssC [Lactococcus ileimucosae]
MKNLFDIPPQTQKNQNFLDEGAYPEALLYAVYVLNTRLERLTLSASHLYDNYEEVAVGLMGEALMIGGSRAAHGRFQLKDDAREFFVLDARQLHTHFLRLGKGDFIISNTHRNCAIQTQDASTIVIDHRDSKNPQVLLKPEGDFLYFKNQKITSPTGFKWEVGDQLLTPELMIERRPAQWKVTVFTDKVSFKVQNFLEVRRKLEKPQDFPEYRRSPRLNLEVPEDKFSYQKLDAPEESIKNGLVKTILAPLITLGGMAGVSVMTGSNPAMLVATGLTAAMTAVFTVTQYRTDKKEQKARAAEREANYQSYVTKTTSEIARKHRKENQVLHYQQPSPTQLLDKIEQYDARLYERMVNNKDFLQVSLGTGSRPSRLKVSSDYSPRDEDEWAKHVKGLVTHFSKQKEVPIPLDLYRQSLGLVGNYEDLKRTVSHLLLQMAFFHSYRDVNFITLVPESDYESYWKQWRFVPHFKMAAINTRGLVHNAKSRDMILSSFYQLLKTRKQELEASGREKPTFLPHFVFTVFEDAYLAGHGLHAFLAEDMSDLGVTVIWSKEDKKLLPETVTALVEVKNQTAGILVQSNGKIMEQLFKPYPEVEDKEGYEILLRQLGALTHMEVEKNAIPERLSLLEQYMVERTEDLNISERWAQAQPNKSIQSMIGWKGAREPSYWDLHEQVHGPHAIVGGTSGSGKSEFLTTYLIGLAINFSPEDIGMLIIDWKGGGIANTLSDLPHFMGAITNLDGAGTARALASINAELKKRQALFNSYGVNNINGYMKLYRERHHPREGVLYPTEALPHLILVSDEFAELKENVPEFLTELTSVARIGRSLGVHLILATQKPDGVVNDQIDANSKSKVALKMSDENNSRALIKTVDAAHITTAGRGYLRVGESELYELFQSGYGGVAYTPDGTKEEIKDERIYAINELCQAELLYDPREEAVDQESKKEEPESQLSAVIKTIKTLFEASDYQKPQQPWLPNLPEKLATPRVKASNERKLKIPLGLLDIPSAQRQDVYNFDLEEHSHTVIFSSPGFGKSTTLQTLVMNLARQNTPEHLHFNLLDFGTNGLLPLKNLPHVADMVMLEEEEKLSKMLGRISSALATRKALFKTEGVANLKQYESKTGQHLPILVNILDAYDNLTQQDKRKDAIDELLMQVLREGQALGIYLVLTAGRYNGIRMNMMANIQTKLALFLNEDSDLGSIIGREKLEQVEVQGRGQVKLEEALSVQIYLPAQAENEAQLLEVLEHEIKTMDEGWTGERPERIPMVGEYVDFEQFETSDKGEFYLGLNKRDAQPVTFELFKGQPLTLLASNKKQTLFLGDFIAEQLADFEEDIIKIDFIGNLADVPSSLAIGKEEITKQSVDVREALGALTTSQKEEQRIVILNGLSQILAKLQVTAEVFIELLEGTNENTQYILLDLFNNIGSPMNLMTKAIKENLQHILFAGDMQSQALVDLSMEERKRKFALQEMFYLNDESLSMLVLPSKGGGEDE